MCLFDLSPWKWEDIFACIQAIAILVGFYFTYKQLKNQNKNNQANYWIQIVSLFNELSEVRKNFRPGGDWAEQMPQDPDSWSKIERYLGIFKQCELMLKDELISSESFGKLYRDMLTNAVSHQWLWTKMVNDSAVDPDIWVDIFDLCKRLKIKTPQ